VIWNAIILHARWGGYARERGIAVLTVFGNIITSLSWFGVNMLGVGLHSYGFINPVTVKSRRDTANASIGTNTPSTLRPLFSDFSSWSTSNLETI
jgi:hypothetical protein